VTPKFGASLTEADKSVIYDHNVFIIQATGAYFKVKHVLVVPLC
jgi:hypothetical protein